MGAYTVTYSTVDTQGNKYSTTRVVTVVDTSHPVITRTGPATVYIEASPGGVYIDQGATAHDLVDGKITHRIKVGGTVLAVNCSRPATYTVRYNAADAMGISAKEVTRSIIYIYIYQNGATSRFKMCFAIGSQHLWCRRSQPKHVSIRPTL